MHRVVGGTVMEVIERAFQGEAGARELLQNGMMFLWDNDHALNYAAKHLIPVPEDVLWRLPQPAHSPDFNKPVEHAHGYLKDAFWREPDLKEVIAGGVVAIRKRIVKLAKALITPERVRADVSTQHLTWRVVGAPQGEEIEGPAHKKFKGVAGDWPHVSLK